MAKRTKIKEELNKTTNDVDDTTNTSTLSPITSEQQTNSLNNTKIDDSSETPSIASISDELEQFTIIKNNIVKMDDYIKFTELAVKYNLFNNIDLSKLNKQDLITLIGFIIDKLYIKIDELNKMKQDELQRRQSSFDKPVSYNDLLGDFNTYKSWN
jgi:hypothetical protein